MFLAGAQRRDLCLSDWGMLKRAPEKSPKWLAQLSVPADFQHGRGIPTIASTSTAVHLARLL